MCPVYPGTTLSLHAGVFMPAPLGTGVAGAGLSSIEGVKKVALSPFPAYTDVDVLMAPYPFAIPLGLFGRCPPKPGIRWPEVPYNWSLRAACRVDRIACDERSVSALHVCGRFLRSGYPVTSAAAAAPPPLPNPRSLLPN